ncbi:MAG TPA: 4-alpha-glucanotransferase [Candidatus Omnitrophota bacterium]|nr:4-alpha-glucanotransferase [Candidatus Omnitrophota bacterium]
MMDGRKSGILLHISSLPSRFGIGDLGPGAYRFVDFLSQSKQKLWQILPLNPTNPVMSHSPYSSPSAFAGNRFFISPELLVEEGLLEPKDIQKIPSFDTEKINYKAVIQLKSRLFEKVIKNFNRQELNYQAFVEESRFWLQDYAAFKWLKRKFSEKCWNEWPESYRSHDAKALEALAQKDEAGIEEFKIMQFLFFKQWSGLKNYCWQKGVEIVGDIPIYVDLDSVDVWENPKNFKLDDHGKPLFVAGAPPDSFSETGQRWGNPVYDWEYQKQNQFEWWMNRMHFNLKLFDWVRVDHFRGFINYWEIPAAEKTAINGNWVDVPTDEFLGTLRSQRDQLPIIAEDLGMISEEVHRKISEIGFPGMKVLQFAFGSDAYNPYLPHNYHNPNCVVYTGTHDNNTTVGWFKHGINEWERKNLHEYLKSDLSVTDIHWKLISLAMHSKANWAIFPMQDVLGLDEHARMNTPGTTKGNWVWRLKEKQLTPELAKNLANLSTASQRG